MFIISLVQDVAIGLRYIATSWRNTGISIKLSPMKWLKIVSYSTITDINVSGLSVYANCFLFAFFVIADKSKVE